MKNVNLDFSGIKMLVMDVDGIMTDGGMFFSGNGEIVKRFNALDGFGLKTLIESGIKVGIISFNVTDVIKHRTNSLGIHKVLTGVKEKGKALEEISAEFKIPLKDIVYMGDDKLDIAALELAGISVTVPNAADEVKFIADMVTEKCGGQGAVREVCDYILKAGRRPKTIGVIPARYKSKRFEGKPLAVIDGLPMVVRVYRQAEKARLDNLIVATDDRRILDVCEKYNVKASISDKNFNNGTERVWEVAKNYQADVIVNIQGDEPLIEADVINKLINQFRINPALDMATAMVKVSGDKNIEDENIVKVVSDKNDFALYFSRKPLLYKDKSGKSFFNRHLGVYAFGRSAIEKYCACSVSQMEMAERLEQLRALDNGLQIKVVEVVGDYSGVNVLEDIAKVERILKDR